MGLYMQAFVPAEPPIDGRYVVWTKENPALCSKCTKVNMGLAGIIAKHKNVAERTFMDRPKDHFDDIRPIADHVRHQCADELRLAARGFRNAALRQNARVGPPASGYEAAANFITRQALQGEA